MLSSAMDSGHLRIDRDYLPFGRLSSETIEKARELLIEIKWVLNIEHSFIGSNMTVVVVKYHCRRDTDLRCCEILSNFKEDA